MEVTLKKDVSSRGKKRKLYAKKGDLVKVIKDSEDDLLFVEKGGERFSVLKQDTDYV